MTTKPLLLWKSDIMEPPPPSPSAIPRPPACIISLSLKFNDNIVIFSIAAWLKPHVAYTQPDAACHVYLTVQLC